MHLMQFLTNRGTQLVCLVLKTRDATDTLEAVTLGRNWYNFLTAGRNSYFPLSYASLTMIESGEYYVRGKNKIIYHEYIFTFTYISKVSVWRIIGSIILHRKRTDTIRH